MRIEVRGADGQPAIVDDAYLGMHVDDVPQRSLSGVDGAGEEAVVTLVRLDQRRDLTARDVRAVVRSRREENDDPEVIGRWMRELVGEDVDDLGRPEELVLEIHEVL